MRIITQKREKKKKNLKQEAMMTFFEKTMIVLKKEYRRVCERLDLTTRIVYKKVSVCVCIQWKVKGPVVIVQVCVLCL